MFEFVSQHQFGIAVAAYWIFSAAVSSLPDPSPSGSAGYLWLYRFCHTTAGNITTALGSRIPELKALLIVLLAPLLVASTACAARYTVHPGALNTVDSAAYDTLLIAETAIDQSRMAYQSGQLPSDAKDSLDTLVGSYNAARDSWLTYRGAIATNAPSGQYMEQLNKNLSDLTSAIRALKRKGVKP